MRHFFTGQLMGPLLSYLTAPRIEKATLNHLRPLPEPIRILVMVMWRKTRWKTHQIMQRNKVHTGLSVTVLSRDLDEASACLD